MGNWIDELDEDTKRFDRELGEDAKRWDREVWQGDDGKAEDDEDEDED